MSEMSTNILQLLGAQYQHETINSLRYYQRSTFADYVGLPSVAKFFRQEADGERGHADRIFKYVNAKSLIVPISGLAFTEPDMTAQTDIVSIFETALAAEKDTSSLLENIVDTARNEGDTMTEQWLMDADGLIKEQVEEENIYQTILDHVKLMDQNGPSFYHDVDNFIRKNFLG